MKIFTRKRASPGNPNEMSQAPCSRSVVMACLLSPIRSAAIWRVSSGVREVSPGTCTGSLLFFRTLLLVEAGFYAGTQAGQQVLCTLGILPGGCKLQILLEGFGSSRSCNRLISLQRGLAQQVDAFLVVGVGAVRVGGNALVERSIGLVR